MTVPAVATIAIVKGAISFAVAHRRAQSVRGVSAMTAGVKKAQNYRVPAARRSSNATLMCVDALLVVRRGVEWLAHSVI